MQGVLDRRGDSMPVFAGSGGFWCWVMNHQIASSTTMTIRMIAHIGKPLEVAQQRALVAAAAALLAAELAPAASLRRSRRSKRVEVADMGRRAAAAPPRPASSPEAPSAFESSGGSAAEIAPF